MCRLQRGTAFAVAVLFVLVYPGAVRPTQARTPEEGTPEAAEWTVRSGADVSAATNVPGARVVDLIRPAGKSAAPSTALRVKDVPVVGGTVDFDLRAFDVFTPDAKVVAIVDGVEVPIAKPTAVVYQGRSVDGQGSMFLAVDGNRYQASVTYGGETSIVGPWEHDGLQHVMAKGGDLPKVNAAEYCGADFLPENQQFLSRWTETTAAKVENAGLREADIMLDVSQSLYTNVFGSNTTTAGNYVKALVGAVSAIYERDVNVRLRISMLSIWTSPDPFVGTSSSQQLGNYVTWARANRTAVSRDYGHLLLNGNSTNYGGIAYLGVLCDSQFGYGLSNIYGHASFPTPSYYWDMDCVSHEMGHNFGSPHTHCYSPPIDMCYNAESGCYNGSVIPTTGTIMSYCHLTSGGKVLLFSAREIAVITSGASSSSCVSVVPDVARDTIAVYNPLTGVFFLRNVHGGGNADGVVSYGAGGAGLIPLEGDWNGDGVDTPGLYNPVTGFFFLRNSNSGGAADVVFSFGAGGAGLRPLSGDWNGDGVDSIGVYNPVTGTFFLRNSNTGGSADRVFSFGPAGLEPVVGDWNGDGIDTVGVFNPVTSAFFLRNYHSPGAADVTVSFGPPGGGLLPVVGDWNGDSLSTVGLYNPANGTFSLRNSLTGGAADLTYAFGASGLTPLCGNFDGN